MNNLQQKLNHLKWLKSAGIEYYCSTQKDSENSLIKTLQQLSINNTEMESLIAKQPETPPAIIKKKTTSTADSPMVIEARKLADSAGSLTDLRKAIENFDGCDLKKFATKTVFADGVTDAKILLVGEAPGATEDKQGIPFCGESGRLLDKMLASIGLCRTKNVYITNTIFWRPPANRRPTNEEMEICKPFVEKHIALIKPKLIILVGGTATTSLLGKNEGISYIRRNNYSYTNQYLSEPIHTTAIFHPAYLLRQPMQKKTTWYDLLKIQQFIKEKIGELK